MMSFVFRHLKNKILFLLTLIKVIKAKRSFARASNSVTWLGQETLEKFYQHYHHKFGEKRWIANKPKSDNKPKLGSIPRDEQEKLKAVESVIQAHISKKTQNILEVGCGTGIISYALQRLGYMVTATDITSKRISKEVMQSVVNFLQMDASQLQFEDEQFDFIFSYNTFEHFDDPEKVLQEMMRVVKTGGYIYLAFNPLYRSAWGLHAASSIPIPYCQFLFSEESLQNFAVSKSLPKIHFTQVNKWSLKNYRELWQKYTNVLKKVHYLEKYETRHVDLIAQYPICFKSISEDFEDFIISGIVVLFQKV